MLAVNPPPEKESKLFTDIENWRSTYKKLLKDNDQAGDSAKHYHDIVELFDLFEQFCKDYINRFYDKSVKLDEATFPPEWLASTIEKVLLGYWEPIERAAEQYQVGFYKGLLDGGYRKLETSQMGRQQIGLDKPIVLYLEKTGVYKRYPFGNIYLIGIPLMDAYNDEWNAMWHELGHHLYWNSRINFENQSYYQGKGPGLFDQALNKAVISLKARDAEKKRIREILNLWTEEIFADIIGTKIAGRDFVNAAWIKISRESETANDLFKSDGKHPIPFFLPHIRSFVIGEKFSIPQTAWEQRFGTLSFTKIRDSKNDAYMFGIENLHSALEIYTTKISQALDTVKFESWFSVQGPLDELVNFIKNDHPKYSPADIARALLKPQIVEAGTEWICGNKDCPKKANSSIYIQNILGVGIVGICQTCDSWTWFPSYKPA